MNNNVLYESRRLIDNLTEIGNLTGPELKYLIDDPHPETAHYLAEQASKVRRHIYGDKVYIRGLIEFTNYCKNDCFYCGIKNGNTRLQRYRLSEDQILECCRAGYRLGFRTFVLQGGEDSHWSDERLCSLISKIRSLYPHCAITLSVGERSRQSYEKLFDAGADRYLLRHESFDQIHYEKLHPRIMSQKRRLNCLRDLRDIGYQTGCGFMVGSPYQTADNIVSDLQFIKELKPHMVGIGPFIPASDTPFAKFPAGSADLTVKLLSMIRLLLPRVLLPATTALGSVECDGRERGILAGANVIMPNLSPSNVKDKYRIYDNKLSTGEEAAESVAKLKASMKKIGYEVVSNRGDYIK